MVVVAVANLRCKAIPSRRVHSMAGNKTIALLRNALQMKWQQLCVKQNARALNCLPCNCRNYTMFLTVVNPKVSGTALSTPQCSPHHPAALLDSLLPSTGLHSSSLGRYIYCIVSMSTSGKRLLLLLLSSSSSHLKQLLNPFPPSLLVSGGVGGSVLFF